MNSNSHSCSCNPRIQGINQHSIWWALISENGHGRKEEEPSLCSSRWIQRCSCVSLIHAKAYCEFYLCNLTKQWLVFVPSKYCLSCHPNAPLASVPHPVCTRLALLNSLELHCLHKVETCFEDYHSAVGDLFRSELRRELCKYINLKHDQNAIG